MVYDGFTTFNVSTQDGIAWVTFDFPPGQYSRPADAGRSEQAG